MKRKNMFFLAGGLLCLLVILTGVYMYKKPRQAASAAKTDLSVEAKALYDAYNANEQEASKRFSNKVLEVTGTVSQVETTGKTFSLLLNGGGEGETNGVNCNITDSSAKAPTAGQKVKVKGRCTGFLMDVTLTDAALLTNDSSQ